MDLNNLYTLQQTDFANIEYGYSDVNRTKLSNIYRSGCGAVTFLNILYNYYGYRINDPNEDVRNIAKVAIETKARVDGVGTNMQTLASSEWAKAQGVSFKYGNLTSLKTHLKNGGVASFSVGAQKMLSTDGHIVSAVGYEEETDEFYVVDPYLYSNKYGGNRAQYQVKVVDYDKGLIKIKADVLAKDIKQGSILLYEEGQLKASNIEKEIKEEEQKETVKEVTETKITKVEYMPDFIPIIYTDDMTMDITIR